MSAPDPGHVGPEGGPDPWEARMEFGQLFLRHLAALGRPLISPALPPLDAAAYLEMIELGEMLARYDRAPGARPKLYRDPAYLHGALAAGVTWEQLAAATGDSETAIRARYRQWAAERHRAKTALGLAALADEEYAAAIKRAESED